MEDVYGAVDLYWICGREPHLPSFRKKKTCDNLWISLRCFFVEWNPECRILDSQVSCAGIFFTDNFVQELQATAANRTF